MRILFAAAAAAVASSSAGCYGPMYQPPYGYSAPGGYPGSMNTLTPGPVYAPGGAMPQGGTMPGPAYGTPQPYTPPAGGGSAPYYNPGVGPSATTRPAPTYADPGADAGGGNELGMYTSPVLQRTGGQTYAPPPQPMPLNNALPLASGNDFSMPTARGEAEFGSEAAMDEGDATFNKPVLPYLPVSSAPVYRTPAY